jgi:predicted transcriptional regulator
MTDEDPPPPVSPDHVAEIVSSYVRYHQVSVDQLAALIIEVHRALVGLGRPSGGKPPRPAVPIRRSLHRDYVVCLECGFHAQTLRRHLRVMHGLTAADYCIRWQLPDSYPLIAPAYSVRRSRVAKEIGLGRYGGRGRGPPATEQPVARRRARRPRRPPT